MYLQNTSLANLPPTGFSYDESLAAEGVGVIDGAQKTGSLIASAFLGTLLLIGTGATQHAQYHWLGETETIITETQLQQGMTQEKTSFEIQSFDEQLRQVKRFMGLNILELAAVLQVSRPTIYGWIESKEIKVRKKSQERLNNLYAIGKAWKEKKLGRLGSYLHKSLGESNESLFALLKSDSLDLYRIRQDLNNIAQLIITKRKADKAHEALLRKHGFEPMSREDMEDRLNDIDFMG